MQPALAADYRAMPLWHADHAAVEVDDARALPSAVDVAIIGGGYCGLSAAAELARRRRQVVVLEADPIGVGASTRNGGMVIPELKLGPRSLAEKHGPLGKELVDSVLDAFALTESTIAEHGIDCSYQRSGGLLLAHHERQVEALREATDEWREVLGDEVRFLDRDALSEEVGSDAYLGGMLMERTGAIQPAKYHAGLVRIAVDAGAELHDRTRATALEANRNGGFRVATDRGPVEAADVLVATNAYADGLVPRLRRRVLPIGSFIIATEPLDPALAHATIPRGRMLYDTKRFLFYWRLSPDGRIVFGGRTNLAPSTVERARDVLAREMVRVHPQLTDVKIAYAWGGNVALTIDRLPHAGRIDGVAYATGCNGTGVALMTWLGTRMAAWMTGDDDTPPFSRLPSRPIPLHALRSMWLPVLGVGVRGLDRLGR